MKKKHNNKVEINWFSFFSKEVLEKMKVKREDWEQTIWELLVEVLNNPENHWKTKIKINC